MIVLHSTGTRATLRDILRTFCRIVADGSPLIGTTDAQGKGYRARWANVREPTDAELRSVGHSYVIETAQPTPGQREVVRPGPLELVDGSWRQTWIVRAMTPEEVAAAEAAAAAAAEAQQIRALISDLRNGAGTVAQRLTRCERVLVRLIREALGE